MKFNIDRRDNAITVTSTYDIGEKYISALRWNESDGEITKEKCESLCPGATFIGVRPTRMWSPDLDLVTRYYILLELVK